MTTEPDVTVPPVLILAYRRPDLVTQVMRAVAEAQPKQVFLACDGPHRDRLEEVELVAETRATMEREISWDCEVHTRYLESNHGCRRGVEGAISWFFDHVNEGIILEDDCVPHVEFFSFCAELLGRYRDDERVMHISGDGAVRHPDTGPHTSYAFSSEALVWGWATWRRAWRRYDSELQLWRQIRLDPEGSRQAFGSRAAAEWWSRVLDRLLFEGRPDSWAYRWSFSVMANEGVCIVPAVNLVSNVGFRPDSTHTFNSMSPRANVGVGPILPLRHPATIDIKLSSDLAFQHQLRGFAPKSWRRTLKKNRKYVGRWLRRIRSWIRIRMYQSA